MTFKVSDNQYSRPRLTTAGLLVSNFSKVGFFAFPLNSLMLSVSLYRGLHNSHYRLVVGHARHGFFAKSF